MEFEARNNKKYKVKSIINSLIYNKTVENQFQGLYYLVLWKNYLEKKALRSL